MAKSEQDYSEIIPVPRGGTFSVKFGVYPANGNNSICYCTDMARASIIKEVLDFWVASHTDKEFEALVERAQQNTTKEKKEL